MATPVSALELRSYDLVREVSPGAIDFYVDELSGIYLPDEFKEQHADVFDVKYWEPADRLCGKFGRFALWLVPEEGKEEPLEGILVMGTTIGVRGIDRYGEMESLRHYTLNEKVRIVLEERDLLGKRVAVDRLDYGATRIELDDAGKPQVVDVSASSIDFGRAAAEGRQKTCEMFAQLLGSEIEVVNSEPKPREYERIVS